MFVGPCDGRLMQVKKPWLSVVAEEHFHSAPALLRSNNPNNISFLPCLVVLDILKRLGSMYISAPGK